jgi:hypothetical protein
MGMIGPMLAAPGFHLRPVNWDVQTDLIAKKCAIGMGTVPICNAISDERVAAGESSAVLIHSAIRSTQRIIFGESSDAGDVST